MFQKMEERKVGREKEGKKSHVGLRPQHESLFFFSPVMGSMLKLFRRRFSSLSLPGISNIIYSLPNLNMPGNEALNSMKSFPL